MSALPQKAEICGAATRVRFGPTAEMLSLGDQIALSKLVQVGTEVRLRAIVPKALLPALVGVEPAIIRTGRLTSPCARRRRTRKPYGSASSNRTTHWPPVATWTNPGPACVDMPTGIQAAIDGHITIDVDVLFDIHVAVDVLVDADIGFRLHAFTGTFVCFVRTSSAFSLRDLN